MGEGDESERLSKEQSRIIQWTNLFVSEMLPAAKSSDLNLFMLTVNLKNGIFIISPSIGWNELIPTCALIVRICKYAQLN